MVGRDGAQGPPGGEGGGAGLVERGKEIVQQEPCAGTEAWGRFVCVLMCGGGSG